MQKKILCLLIYFLLTLTGLVFQDVLSFYLKDYGYLIPNVAICLFVYLGFYEYQVFGVVLCFLIGLLADINGGLLIGPWATVGVSIYIMLSLYAPRIFVISRSSISFALLVCTVLSYTMYFLLISISTDREIPSVTGIVGQIISNLVFGQIIFFILDRLSEFRALKFLKPSESIY